MQRKRLFISKRISVKAIINLIEIKIDVQLTLFFSKQFSLTTLENLKYFNATFMLRKRLIFYFALSSSLFIFILNQSKI